MEDSGDQRSGGESDTRLGRSGWRREKGTELLIEIAQGRIVEEEGFINMREPFLHGVVLCKEIDSHSPERSPASHAGNSVYPTASPHVVFIFTA